MSPRLKAYVKDSAADFRVVGSEIALIVGAALVGFGRGIQDADWVIGGAFQLLSLFVKQLTDLAQNHDVFPLMHIVLAHLVVLSNDPEPSEHLRDRRLWGDVRSF